MDRIGSGLTTRFVQPKGFVTLGPSKAMFGIPIGDKAGAMLDEVVLQLNTRAAKAGIPL